VSLARRHQLHPRTVRLVQTGFAGIALAALLAGLLPPGVYSKDLQVEYLTAWAWRDGADIFTPLTELSARYFPLPTEQFAHPSPHPPVLALLAIPLTCLPFPVVATLWLAFNLFLLLTVGRWLGFSVSGSLALALWPPLLSVLSIGQFELAVLVLAMLGWRAAAAGRDWHAGLWLGVAAAIKVYPVLFVVPYAARRRWRVALAAAAVILVGQVGNLVAAGGSGFLRYYGDILPAVSHFYMHTVLNSSPYAALLRLFGGPSDVTPLIHAPAVVVPLAMLVSLSSCVALAMLEPEAAPVAALVGLPAVWNYYAVLALPQIVALLRFGGARLRVIVVIAAASFTVPLARFVFQIWSGLLPWSAAAAPTAALLTAVQPAGFIGLLLLSLEMHARARRSKESGTPPAPARPVAA